MLIHRDNFGNWLKLKNLSRVVTGVVRSVVICVAGKDGKRKLLQRAVQHLVPLEIRSEPVREVDVYRENDNDNNLDDQSCGKERRPKRNAAIIGEILRKDNS